jgi:hypothetical protein
MVKDATAGNLDFTACVTRDGAPTAEPKTPCQGPVIEVSNVKITSEAIEIHYRGSGWDPKGGPITFSWGNVTFQTAETASFDHSFKIPFWPHRTTVEGAMSGAVGNGYCWGELGARQGKSFAASGIVKGKWGAGCCTAPIRGSKPMTRDAKARTRRSSISRACRSWRSASSEAGAFSPRASSPTTFSGRGRIRR